MEPDGSKSEPKPKAEPQATDSSQEAASPSPLQLKRDEDFVSLYANNVRFESSVWDLKLIFGQLDQSTGGEVIELHTAITMPWAAVKIMLHYLRLNIALHELENGKVKINPRLFPTPPPPLTPEMESNELTMKGREIAYKLRDEFIAKQSMD